jgi:hypothetical protein
MNRFLLAAAIGISVVAVFPALATPPLLDYPWVLLGLDIYMGAVSARYCSRCRHGFCVWGGTSSLSDKGRVRSSLAARNPEICWPVPCTRKFRLVPLLRFADLGAVDAMTCAPGLGLDIV